MVNEWSEFLQYFAPMDCIITFLFCFAWPFNEAVIKLIDFDIKVIPAFRVSRKKQKTSHAAICSESA